MSKLGLASERILGVSDAGYMYLAFRVKDPSGNPVANAPFWIDIYAPPGQSSSYQHSLKLTTDAKGIMTASVPASEFANRQVSITPLLPYPDGPANQAIVWQVPFTFTASQSNVVDIVLKPGGGLTTTSVDKLPNLVPAPGKIPAPPPDQAAPAPVESGMPVGTYVLLAAAGFLAGWFLIPMALKYLSKKGVPSG